MARLDVFPDGDLWAKLYDWVSEKRKSVSPPNETGLDIPELIQSLVVPRDAAEGLMMSLQPLATAHQVENRLVEYAKRGLDAVPSMYRDIYHPHSPSYRGRIDASKFYDPQINTDIKKLSEHILETNFSPRKSPQTNPEELFKGTTGIEFVPKTGSFGTATVYPGSISKYNDLLRNTYHQGKVMPYGSMAGEDTLMEIASDFGKLVRRGSGTEAGLDEIARYIQYTLEHEGAHLNQITGNAAPKERQLMEYVNQMVKNNPERNITHSAAVPDFPVGAVRSAEELMSGLKPPSDRWLELGYSHRPVPLHEGSAIMKPQGKHTRAESWLYNPNEVYAETVAMGRTVPGDASYLDPFWLDRKTNSNIIEFLKRGNY
jgi:hypothetical protein